MQFKHLVFVSFSSVSCWSCSKSPTQSAQNLTGYIETVQAYISAPQSGWIEALEAEEGSHVQPGQVLIRLDNDAQQFALKQAQAKLAKARQQLQDIQSGSRQEEIEVVQLQLKEQQALFKEATHELTRQKKMRATDATSEAALDRAQTNYNALNAKLLQLQQQLQVMKLPAREHVIGAASKQVEAAQQEMKLQQWHVQQRTLISRQIGMVEQVFFRQGEYVAQGTPILSVLLADQSKVRFFISQARLSEIQPGQQITLVNDAMQQGQATISYIARQPEFVPPVLYSNESRDKLVFMVEALISGSRPRSSAAAPA